MTKGHQSGGPTTLFREKLFFGIMPVMQWNFQTKQKQHQARLYQMVSKFRHSMCPECTMRAKRVCGLSESYRGCPGLAWLRPTVTKMESPDLNCDNRGHLQSFRQSDSSDTYSANNNDGFVLAEPRGRTRWNPMEIAFFFIRVLWIFHVEKEVKIKKIFIEDKNNW